MVKKIGSFLKDNVLVIVSGCLIPILFYGVIAGVWWNMQRNGIAELQEHGYESEETYSKYRNAQQAEIYELKTEMREIRSEMEAYSGE